MRHSLIIALLWFLCVFRRLFSGRVSSGVIEPKNILVVQMAKLGDMVCTTPLFHGLKNAKFYPNVTVIGNSINKELLDGNRDVDEYVIFDSLYSVYRKIKERNFDTAIVVEPDIVSVALCYLAGVPHIVAPRVVNGYSRFETLWYRSLRAITGLSVVNHRMHHYAPGEYLRLLSPLGINTEDTTKHLVFSDSAKQSVKKLLKKESGKIYIGISPSTGDKVKNWGGKNFSMLANLLMDNYSNIRVVVFGGERDAEDVKKMIEGLNVGYLDLSSRLSIDELKAAISMLDVFISSDTGPIYIAEVFNLYTVNILGPIDEREQTPRGDKHRNLIPPWPRVPQMFVMNPDDYDPKELKRQMDSIGPDMVFEVCKNILKRFYD